ncbi:MAG: DUF1501 domain-containing protein [Pirellulales bacterium]
MFRDRIEARSRTGHRSQAAGLLDSTVVHWGGRDGTFTGDSKREKNIGRDHNTFGFSQWMAGGGFKAGYVHGKTDEIGHKAVEDVVNHYDYHATLAHLLEWTTSRFNSSVPTESKN